ncbi:MAG: phosphohydrolase [Flavobacteriales bacterium]|nr:phosphohydrolase [Flavobacteriales bacterium]
MNKKKIINDPVYGFVNIPFDIVFDIIEHPYFQRLRRIRQLGLTSMVYPGAYHSRFHHVIGAMHLAKQAIEILQSKGHQISEEECKAVICGVLLHDIGHGPFSHALEFTLVNGINHEELSILFMEELNREFNGELDLTIEIFTNKYHKKFLHQLISSQLDVDRLDYLNRDSFYTGVNEGVVGVDRIIKLLNVHNDELVIDEKGIYSIEKFLVARRIMYWQVYLHKTVVAAEFLVINILTKAKALVIQGEPLFCTKSLKKFLQSNSSLDDFKLNPDLLREFAQLDDNDIFTCVKEWSKYSDKTLALLCDMMINRKLYRIEISSQPYNAEYINELRIKAVKQLNIDPEDVQYFVFSDTIQNNAYNQKKDRISILYKNKTTKDIAEASDQLNISSLSTPVTKFFICYPKSLVL